MIVEVSIIIIHSAAIRALEKAQEWQLALGLLSVIVKMNNMIIHSVAFSAFEKAEE